MVQASVSKDGFFLKLRSPCPLVNEVWPFLALHRVKLGQDGHQGLGTLNLDIPSTYLKLRVLWTVKSPITQPSGHAP